MLSESAQSVLVDIAHRVPKRKLFVSYTPVVHKICDYYLWDDVRQIRVLVLPEVIDELLAHEYIRIMPTKGVMLTQKGIDSVDNYLIRTVTKNSHNRDIEIVTSPPPY